MRPDAVLVARTSEGLDHLSTIIPYLLDDRLIIVAQGIESLDSEFVEKKHPEWTVQNYLQGRGVDIWFNNGEATYLSQVQGVRFTVKIVTAKTDFKTYLETSDAHVVYDGHARYGRGPCFGPKPDKGEDWEDGNAAQTTGLLRMGYPFISVSTHEILKHGYTASLVREIEAMPSADRHPTARYVSWRPYTLDQLDPSGELHKQVRQPVLPGERFWGYMGWLDGDKGPQVMLHAGWEYTTCTPYDVGATDMKCRVFCHFGCSTMKHNYPIVRKRKGWTRTDDNHYAYWTTNPSDVQVVRMWLYHVLTYPTYNAFEPWKASIEHAVKKTNQDLRRAGESYKVY